MNAIRLVIAFALHLVLFTLNVNAQTQKPELVIQAGHTSPVLSVSFSPDGKLLASGSGGDMFQFWEVNVIKIWDVATGLELRSIPSDAPVSQVGFSADGKRVAAPGKDGMNVWDVITGTKLPAEAAGAGEDFKIYSATPDRKVEAEPDGKNIRLLDAQAGQPVRTFASRTSDFQKVLFSPDSTILATGGERFSVRLWDLRSGVLRTLEGHTDYPVAADFSPDSRLFATGGRDLTVRVWDVAGGRETAKLTGHTGKNVRWIKFSPDGRTLISADTEGFKLWDVATGRELTSAGGDFDEHPVFKRAVFSPTGEILAAFSGKMLKVWDTRTGRQLHALPGRAKDALTFSPDGKILLSTEYFNGGFELWDVAGMKRIAEIFNPGSERINFVGAAISPDSRIVAVATRRSTRASLLSFYEADTGKLIRTVEVGVQDFMAHSVFLAFSPDAKRLVCVRGKDVVVWDAAAIGEAKRFKIETPTETFRELWPIAPQYFLRQDYSQYSPNGVYFVEFGLNGELQLQEPSTGRTVISMMGVDEKDWLVATPEGLFDGSPAGWKLLLWRFDNDTFNHAPGEAFFNEFFYPGLLAEVLAGKAPQPPDGRELARVDRRQPAVKVTQLAERGHPGVTKRNVAHDKRTITLAVEVEESVEKSSQPGRHPTPGARDVRLFRNGSLVRVWRGDVLKGRKSVTLKTAVPIVAGENRFVAYAFNRDNVKSRDASLTVAGDESLKRTGTARVLAVGINRYANKHYDLRYAVADARSFAAAFSEQQTKLGRFAGVELTQLHDGEATKANILKALASLAAKAQPEDVVVIYFAGHGTAQRERFYLIPHDLGHAGARDVKTEFSLSAILKRSISDQELERVLEPLDAGQLIMVIDACNSGQALEAEEKRRGPMNSKGLAQLAYEKGMYVLTAAQSFQAALEASRLGHGFLTYALVEEGLKKGMADEEPKDGQVLLREWLDYATVRVPGMQAELMMAAQRGRGLNVAFVIGEETIADPAKRNVQRPRVFYRREADPQPLVIARPRRADGEQDD